MARHKKSGSCTVTTIRFKTKRGKVVEFRGRPGGMTTAGGECKPKHRSTAHLGVVKGAFEAAVKSCDGKSHKRHGKHGASAFNKCIGAKVSGNEEVKEFHQKVLAKRRAG